MFPLAFGFHNLKTAFHQSGRRCFLATVRFVDDPPHAVWMVQSRPTGEGYAWINNRDGQVNIGRISLAHVQHVVGTVTRILCDVAGDQRNGVVVVAGSAWTEVQRYDALEKVFLGSRIPGPTHGGQLFGERRGGQRA